MKHKRHLFIVLIVITLFACSYPKKKTYYSIDEALKNAPDVCSLIVSNKKLKTISPEISQLQNLEYLDLSHNHIENLPKTVGQLSKLKTILINNNKLNSLPSEIKKLELKTLNISKNRTLHEPKFIYDIESLEELYIAGLGWEYNSKDTIYTIIFQGIKNLKKLKKLDISSYTWRVRNFPVEVTKLTHLEELNLSDNWYESIPEELKRLTNLKKVNLSNFGDSITNLELLFMLPKLKDVNLKYNHFSLSKLPISCACQKVLKNIDVSFCKLKEFPIEFFQFSNLRQLNIEGNEINRLPQKLTGFRQLEKFAAGHNPYSKFPKVIEHLVSLKELYLAGNYGICGYSNPLFASSDFDLRNLLQLKILDLKDNQFENLPNGLSKLQNLEILQLTNNHLNSDSCLRLITKLQDLQKLDLSSNGITKLPDTFSNMQSLKTIIIANRYCEGVPVDDGFDKFPSVFCKMPNLTEIVIPGHRIEKIPKEISNLVNLNTLILSDNAIHRKFPEEFLQLDKIESIELYVYCVGETHKYCEEPFIIDPRICKLKNLKSLSFTGHPDTLVIAKIKNCLPDLQIYYDAW